MNYKILLIFLLSIFLIGCEQVAIKPDKIETKIEKKYTNRVPNRVPKITTKVFKLYIKYSEVIKEKPITLWILTPQ